MRIRIATDQLPIDMSWNINFCDNNRQHRMYIPVDSNEDGRCNKQPENKKHEEYAVW